MYSRKCDCGFDCGHAESSQDGEESELHVEEKMIDREVFDGVFWTLDVREMDLCCWRVDVRECSLYVVSHRCLPNISHMIRSRLGLCWRGSR